MSIEIIKAIRQVEDEAQQLVRQSANDARQIVSEAQAQSYKIVEQAEQEAEADAKRIIQEAELAVNEQISRIYANVDRECGEMKKQAGSKIDAAVDMIVGRIVKADVGS